MAKIFLVTTEGRNLLLQSVQGSAPVITKVKLGSGRYTPTLGQTDIQTPFSPVRELSVIRASVANARLDLGIDITENANFDVGEVGFFVGTKLFAIAAATSPDWLVERRVGTDGDLRTYSFNLQDGESAQGSQTFPVAPTMSKTVAGIQRLRNPDSDPRTDTEHPTTFGDIPDAGPGVKGLSEPAAATGNADADSVDKYLTPGNVDHYVGGSNKVADQLTSGSPPSSETDAGLSVTITPSSSTAKILLTLTCVIDRLAGSVGTHDLYLFLYEGSTKIAGDSEGYFVYGAPNAQSNILTKIITPGDTDSHTYKVRWRKSSGNLGISSDAPMVLTAEEI